MKKLYLTLLALGAFAGAQAMTLSFWLGNKEITPGTTVEYNDVNIDDYETYLEVKMAPALYLSTDMYSSKLKVTATCTSGQSIQMCAGGNCMGGESVTKENLRVQTGEKFALDFEYVEEFDAGAKIPVVTTLFEAEDVTEPGTATQFVLVMGEKGASVSLVELSEGVTVCPGALCYATEARQQLEIYGADGVCAFSGAVSGEGKVELRPGFYVYTLGQSTGKVYIR